jgi:hypothetical protein
MDLFGDFVFARLAGLALGAHDLGTEALVEAVNTASTVDAVHLASPERMSVRCDFEGNHLEFDTVNGLLVLDAFGGAGCIFLTGVRVNEQGLAVFGMEALFHGKTYGFDV